MEVVALHLRANNDVNGNPRRCFVVLDDRSRFVEAIDEGYEGMAALYSKYPQFGPGGDCFAQAIDVGVGEYRRMLRRDRPSYV
jgi:hypothetical protein